MLSPNNPAGLSRERALEVLDQLGRAVTELEHLEAESGGPRGTRSA